MFIMDLCRGVIVSIYDIWSGEDMGIYGEGFVGLYSYLVEGILDYVVCMGLDVRLYGLSVLNLGLSAYSFGGGMLWSSGGLGVYDLGIRLVLLGLDYRLGGSLWGRMELGDRVEFLKLGASWVDLGLWLRVFRDIRGDMVFRYIGGVKLARVERGFVVRGGYRFRYRKNMYLSKYGDGGYLVGKKGVVKKKLIN
jgi:hypothetical protein